MLRIRCAVVVIVALVSVFAQRDGACIVDVGNPTNMVLQLNTNEPQHVLYEPVVLTYSLSNPTDGRIVSKARMELSGQYLKIFIRHEGEEKSQKFYSGAVEDTFGYPDLVLQPHQSTVADVSLFFNDLNGKLVFSNVGKYEVTAKMYLGNLPEPTYVESGPLKIEIVAPRIQDEKVSKEIGSQEDLITLLRSGPRAYCKGRGETKCFDRLQALCRDYAASAYLPYISFSLGGAMLWEGAGVSPKYDRGIEILEGFLQKWPSHPLAPKVTGSLVYALSKAGKTKDAEQLVEQFEQKYPTRSSPRGILQASSHR